MKLEIRRASFAEKDIVANLMNLYQYDFTDFGGDPVGDRGDFSYKYFDDYWEDQSRTPFLIYADNRLAGFCLVNTRSLLGDSNVHAIAEFFILRYLRRSGIGLSAAREVIKIFPGVWEVSQTHQNVGAQQFWLKVVSSLVQENFERFDLKELRKIVLRFEF